MCRAIFGNARFPFVLMLWAAVEGLCGRSLSPRNIFYTKLFSQLRCADKLITDSKKVLNHWGGQGGGSAKLRTLTAASPVCGYI